jgi:hypothetical protein
MRDASVFMIKGNARAFMIGDGMRGASAFIIKGDVPLANSVSLLSEKRHVSGINLTETRQKLDHLLLPTTESVLILTNASVSCFFRSETITFANVFDLCLRFEFLT